MPRAATTTVPTHVTRKDGVRTIVHRKVDGGGSATDVRVNNVPLIPLVANDEPDTAAEFDTVIDSLSKKQDKKMTQDQICDLINDLDISAETMVMATDLVQGKFLTAFGDDPEGDPKVQVRALLPAFSKYRLGMDDD
jgi:hypothetical protein